MEWGLLLLGLTVVLAVWLLVLAFGEVRASCVRGPDLTEPSREVVASVAGGKLLAEGLAAMRAGLGRTVEGLFAETGGLASADPRLFAVADRVLPPRLVAGLATLEAGVAGRTALTRLQDPGVGPKILAGIIGVDPVLTGNVLKIANSPLFGLRCAISSLEQAIGILGLANLKTLIYTEMLERTAARAGLARHLRRDLFIHLGKTAVMARHIAPAFAGVEPGTMQTLGLLHDIGRLALYGPGDTAFLADPQAEEQAFGVNHAVAGWAVCGGFELPAMLCHGVRLHHAPLVVEMEDLVDAELGAIRYGLALCVADLLVRALESPQPAPPLPLRASYRSLVRETVLFRLVEDAALHQGLRQTLAMLLVAASG